MIPSPLPVSAASRSPQPAQHDAEPTVWDAITLLPNPTPEIALDEIDTSLHVAGRDCALPILLTAEREPSDGPVVQRLARLAQRFRLPLVVGGAHVLFADAATAATLHAVRDRAPDALLLGAIPATTLVAPERQGTVSAEGLREAFAASGLDGVLVRLNFAEAALAQTAGLDATGTLDTIAALVRHLRAPVLAASSTGIPRGRARALTERGVAGFVVGGAESFAVEPGDSSGPEQGLRGTFAGWGLPTLAAVRMLRTIGGVVISDGPIGSGLDAAKALALGADMVTLALPVDEATDGSALAARIDTFARELRTAMFLTGAATLGAARQVPFSVTGEQREWLEAAESLWRTDTHFT